MAFDLIHLGRIFILAVYVVDLVGEVVQIFGPWRHHGGGTDVDQEPATEAQRARPLLQSAQHSLVGESGADHPGGKKLVAAAAVVGQVAAVAAAERAEVTLVRLLSRVRAHVGFQVALVCGRKRAKLAAMRFFTW